MTHPTNETNPLEWKQIGAWLGGTVSAVATSPRFTSDRLVLAATMAGIYRSTNGGQQWALSTRGLTDPTTQVLAFAPQSPEGERTAFAATLHGRLYHSPDGGLSWQELRGWAGLGMIVDIAISPNYAADGTLLVATAEGIFRSQDRGWNWERASFGLLDLEVLCVVCAPDFARSEVAWAGTALGGLYRSRNAGRAWRESGLGLADSTINCVAISPAFEADQTLFVGTETAGVFRSTDAGRTWQPAGAELAGQCVNCLALSPHFDRDQTLLAGTTAGIFRSTDGGEHWTSTQGATSIPLSIAWASDDSVVAGTYQDGSFISRDGGRTWQPAVAGLAAHVPPLVLRCPAPDRDSLRSEMFFAAGMDDGLVYSPDDGVTWQACETGLDFFEIQAAAASGAGNMITLWVATDEGLYCSDNLGQDWEPVSSPPEAVGQVSLLALAPDFPHNPTVLLGDRAGHLYLSEDAGTHWHRLANRQEEGSLLNAAFSPFYTRDHTLYLVTAAQSDDGSARIQAWQSTDSGAHWEFVAVYAAAMPVAAMAVPPSATDGSFFLATQNCVIRLSLDPTAGTWTAHQFFLERPSRSGDGSLSAQPDEISITALAVSLDYETDRTLYAATNQGVFWSRDAGTTWETLGLGLEERAVVAVLPPTGNNPVRAVTLGGAVWRLNKA